jgi:hypothetical protein
MRPTNLFDNGQEIRALWLPAQLRGHDVIIFNEAFDDGVRGVLLAGLTNDYPHVTRILGSDRGFEQDGGVLMVSRWPIVGQDQRLFGDVCTNDGAVFDDCQSDKGVLYAKIVKNNRAYHLFATHTQAGHSATRREVRGRQILIMRDFINSKNIGACEAVIAGGDFNIDRSASPNLEYNKLLNTLSVDEPARLVNLPALNCTYCFGVNEMADDPTEGQAYLDHLLTSRNHLHPIESVVSVRRPRSSAAWRGSIRDLSDHFAIEGAFKFQYIVGSGC